MFKSKTEKLVTRIENLEAGLSELILILTNAGVCGYNLKFDKYGTERRNPREAHDLPWDYRVQVGMEKTFDDIAYPAYKRVNLNVVLDKLVEKCNLKISYKPATHTDEKFEFKNARTVRNKKP